MIRQLRSRRTPLALHLLGGDPASDRNLLCLHQLGGSWSGPGSEDPAAATERWSGARWGLEFTGHGASGRPVGGGYTPENLTADVDAALAELGACWLAGWGLGGYVGLLAFGARPDHVHGLVIGDGWGLDGADFDAAIVPLVEDPPPPLPTVQADPSFAALDPRTDPYAWAELAIDPRPASYALGYSRRILDAHPTAPALVVTAHARPAWLTALLADPAVCTTASTATALELL